MFNFFYDWGKFLNADGTIPEFPIKYNSSRLYGTNEYGEQVELHIGSGLTIVDNTLNAFGDLTQIIDDAVVSTGKTYSSYKITEMIDSIVGFSIVFVDVLPPTGEPNTLYLVPAQLSEEGNIYDEYLYVDDVWELVGSTTIDLSNYYTKDEVDGFINAKQDKLTESSGIKISGNTISANTKATTTADIRLSSGAPVEALGIWSGDTIPQGTSVQDILTQLLCKEIYPNKATKPNISAEGTDFGTKEIGDTVNISTPTLTISDGKFNASFTTPPQPTVSGVTWGTTTLTTATSGFTGTTSVRTVVLGTNKIEYKFSKPYSAPVNKPITNLGNETDITGTGESAIWIAGSATTTCATTAIGVYPCFTNISGSTLITNPDTKCGLTIGSMVTVSNVPSENVAQKHFKFAFPADRTAVFKIRDLQGNFVPFSSTYETTTVSNFYKNTDYKIIATTGDFLGPDNTYRFELSKGLSS